MKKAEKPLDLDATDDDHSRIDDALRRATIEAFRRHRQAGVPVAIWRGGRVVWADPAKLLKKMEADGNGRVRHSARRNR